MKKSVAAISLMASTSFANVMLPTPTADQKPEAANAASKGKPVVVNTYCMSTWALDSDGSQVAGNCDETAANKMYGAKLFDNGCAEGQVSIKSATIKIESCPVFVQL